MKHSDIRRVVFITESDDLANQPDFIEYIHQNKGTMLSVQKCDEGFVCLVHFNSAEEFVCLDNQGSAGTVAETEVVGV